MNYKKFLTLLIIKNLIVAIKIVTLFILYFLEYCIVVDYEFQKHYILKLKMWIYKMALFMFMNPKTILID